MKYKLQTIKRYDFEDFIYCILLKKYIKINKEDMLNKILNIRNNMNSKRINSLIVEDVEINKYWLIGFVEGEGTFGIKNMKPYFQIGQHIKNYNILYKIEEYLENTFSYCILTNKKVLKDRINIVYIYNKNSNVKSLVINNIDDLYYNISPIFECNKMYTRKYIDYKLWLISLKCIKLGYIYFNNGRELMINIVNNINTKRYSTHIDNKELKNVKTLEYITNCWDKLLINDWPIDINKDIDHNRNSRLLIKELRSNNRYRVYIYENSKLLEGSPFKSYAEAHRVLGLNGSSRICYRYLDTGKLYKNKYLITSRLI